MRLQPAITERLQRPTGGGAAGNAQHQMRLSSRTASSLSYRPKLVVPLPISLSIWLGRLARREHVEVRFAPNGSEGRVRVAVSGKVGKRSQVIADREFWGEVLGEEGMAQ